MDSVYSRITAQIEALEIHKFLFTLYQFKLKQSMIADCIATSREANKCVCINRPGN